MRIPRMTFGDLGAQVAACSVAERALVALAERHGRGAARGADGRADRLHRAARPAGDRDLARRHRLLHRLPRLGRRRRLRRADHGARDDRGRRDHGRPDRLVADGARLAEQHALVRAGLRLPGGARGADRRRAEHGRRLPPDPHPHEAGHDRRGRHAGRLLDARRDRVPHRRRRLRRARAAAPGPRRRRGRGRQHARDLRRGAARTASASSSTSSSSAPGAARRRPTATTASRTRRASPRTSRSRSPSPSTRSWSSATGSCPTRAAPACTAAASRSSASGAA